jgi:CheY-like chemotaxis protein
VNGSLYVALVDDEATITRMIRFLIERSLGMAAREFNDSTKALQVLTGDMANVLLVICDLRMPKVDGLQLCRRLRENDPDCPLILLSAYVSEEMEAEARQIGVNRIIPKPFVPAQFLTDVRQLSAERLRHLETQGG